MKQSFSLRSLTFFTVALLFIRLTGDAQADCIRAYRQQAKILKNTAALNGVITATLGCVGALCRAKSIALSQPLVTTALGVPALLSFHAFKDWKGTHQKMIHLLEEVVNYDLTRPNSYYKTLSKLYDEVNEQRSEKGLKSLLFEELVMLIYMGNVERQFCPVSEELAESKRVKKFMKWNGLIEVLSRDALTQQLGLRSLPEINSSSFSSSLIYHSY